MVFTLGFIFHLNPSIIKIEFYMEQQTAFTNNYYCTPFFLQTSAYATALHTFRRPRGHEKIGGGVPNVEPSGGLFVIRFAVAMGTIIFYLLWGIVRTPTPPPNSLTFSFFSPIFKRF